MPSATEELRAAMKRRFGDEIDEQGPMKFLESRGYILGPSWLWKLPSSDHKITEDEGECIDFLFQEWDFGGIDDQ